MAFSYLVSAVTSSTSSSTATTPAIDTTGATLIVVCLDTFKAGTANKTFVDSEGNTWTQLSTDTTVTNVELTWYYCLQPTTSATHTFSSTGVNTYPGIAVSCYGGPANPLYDSTVGVSTAKTNLANTIQPGSLTPTNDNSIVVMVEGHYLLGTQQLTGGTLRKEGPRVTTYMGVAIGEVIQTTAAAVNPTFENTTPNSGERIAAQAAFYAGPEGVERKPLVLGDSGVIEQLQSGDTIAGAGVSNAVDLSPDNCIVRADGVGSAVQLSTAVISDEGNLELTTTATSEASGAHLNLFNVVDTAGQFPVQITSFTAISKNLGVGEACGSLITTGEKNMMFGSGAGQSLTEGSDNVLIGRSAGAAITTGIRNVALGSSALATNISGSQNVAMGRAALVSATGGANTAVGYRAGTTISSGASNTFIGDSSGVTGQLATASNSIGIGVGVVTVTSNTTVIGNSANTDTFLYGNIIVQDDSRLGMNLQGTPNAAVDIEGTGGSTEFRLTRVADNTGAPRIRFRKSRGTPGAEANVASGDIIGTFTFNTYRNGAFQGADSPASCMFFAEVTGTPAGNSVPGDVVFNTTDVGDTANSNSLRISHENGVFIYTRSGGTPTTLPTNAAGFFALGANAQMYTIEENGTVWPLSGEGVIVSPTTTYAVVDNTAVIFADATSGAFTVTLPAVVAGAKVTVKKIDSSANVVTVDGAGTDTIDGSLTQPLAVQYSSLTLVSDGTEWWII